MWTLHRTALAGTGRHRIADGTGWHRTAPDGTLARHARHGRHRTAPDGTWAGTRCDTPSLMQAGTSISELRGLALEDGGLTYVDLELQGALASKRYS